MSERTKITPYRDGPLLVRGPFTLVDQDGKEIDVDRDVVALCRCGRSRLRPFCDGTHNVVGWRAPSTPETTDAPRGSSSRRFLRAAAETVVDNG